MAAMQHIGFNCSDMKASEAFYTKHFGFRRARVFNAGQSGEFIMLRTGSMCLELFQSGDTAARGGDQTVGFKHLAFEVPDLAKAIAALNADGVATGPIHDCAWVTPGMRVCFFQDRDGNTLELMEGWKDQF
ncbi:MAG: VOC family protein [Planctomycetaceae bacterium]|nr:VOC family protein [Planctomycetaceae bacterium]